ncbi:MAG: hypothetical protein ACWA5L_04695 [bacterium]
MTLLKDISFRDGRIIVKPTGAELTLEPTLLKDIARAAHFITEVALIRASRNVKNPYVAAQAPTIGFYPDAPAVWYAIWPVCQLAGLKICKNHQQADILFYFEDKEYCPNPPAAHWPGINFKCTDIRKSKVAKIFQEVFGYNLSIDPCRYHGDVLSKSEANGVHDGKIITCPIDAPQSGQTYQRLIENSQDGQTYIDIRTPIVGGTIPIIYLKHRSKNKRFSNDNAKVTLSNWQHQFSPKEKQLILRFAHRIGLDFGGLDVLRDANDGRLYIVDVNKTDMGPPTALPQKQKLVAMRALASAFRAYTDGLTAKSGSA